MRGQAATAAAGLLQQIVAVDPLAFPTGHGARRPVAVRTHGSVIDQILAHRRPRAAGRPLRASRPSRGRRSRRMCGQYSTDPD